MSVDTQNAAAFETREDAGEGEAGLVRLWMDAITLARKDEERWRKRAIDAHDRYRDEKERKGRRFNVLYSNTQTILPALYNSAPSPDVRRRFGDADEVGKVAAQVLERALSYGIDAYDFDGTMRAVVFDMVLPGRGVARVRYDATVEGGEILDESAPCDYVDWRDFIRGPGRRWGEVPWIGFEHRLTREELVERFGDLGATMGLDVVQDNARKGDDRDVPDVFKRGTVFEVWDKQAREVLFVAPAVKDRVLKREPDPLGLKDFFPTPRPIYDVQDSGDLTPVVPFELYRDQADELDRVTRRITALIEVCKFRGLRDASIQEFTQLAEARDGEFVPIENAMQYIGATGGGGLERAVWTMPLEALVATIQQLAVHREAIKQVIYEITGLSDILRGASVASETATAQQIKSQWGSLRIQDRQAEVQRFARDLIRLKAEIVAERFQPQTLAMMTGVDLPTAEMKAQAQAAAQAGVQDPQIAAILGVPSWDEVLEVLRSDAMRSYRVDIETDSTIQADVARRAEQAGQFVQGFAGFVQAMGPAVQTGMMPMDVAADLLTAFARTFKLGRQAEDALERLGQQAQQPQPDPNAGAAQAAQQAEQARAAAEQQRLQAEMQAKQAELQMKREEVAAKVGLEREKLAIEAQKIEAELALKREGMMADVSLKRETEQARLADAGAARRETLAATQKPAVMVQTDAHGAMEQAAQALVGMAQDQSAALTAAVATMQEGQTAMAQALQMLAQAVAAPREMIRGPDGRAAGSRAVLN